MQTFDAKVNHKDKFIPFVIAYIPNSNLTKQEQFFAENDLNFHNSLSYYAHQIITLYVNSKEEAINQVGELGRTRILCITAGLTYLDKFVQTIINSKYMDLDNWSAELLEWINLESDTTIEIPDKIVNDLRLTGQWGEFSIADNYYRIMNSYKKWYVTNTETIALKTPEQHTNEIFATAGALTPAIEAISNFTKPGYINIVDSSIVAHHMWDYLIENWDGKNYADFIRDFYTKYPSITIDFTAFQENKLQAYSDFLNDENFIDKWELVQKSKQTHHYMDILVDDPCYIIDKSKAPSSYINFSNAYSFYPTAVYFSQENRYKKWLKVYETIRNKNKHGFKVTFNERGMHGILRYRGRRP